MIKVCFNPQSQRFFDALPDSVKKFITSMQEAIDEVVQQKYPGIFVASSGFRDPIYNMSIGGKPDSKHLIGLARDFVPADGDMQKHIIDLKGPFKVVKEKDHFHVEIMLP